VKGVQTCEKELNVNGVEMPMGIDDIARFENKYYLSINLFTYWRWKGFKTS